MSRQEMFNKFLEVMNRFAQIKAIVAVKDGFIMTTPFTICGSLFLLILLWRKREKEAAANER